MSYTPVITLGPTAVTIIAPGPVANAPMLPIILILKPKIFPVLSKANEPSKNWSLP